MFPNRKQPITRWGEFFSSFVFLFVGGFFLLSSIRAGGLDGANVLVRVIFFALGGLAIYAGGRSIWEGLLTIKYRKMLQGDEAMTTAKIVRTKEVEIEVYDENGNYTVKEYEINITFNPIEARTVSENAGYSAKVSGRVYKQLKGREAVSIYYCRNDPQIFRFEGE